MTEATKLRFAIETLCVDHREFAGHYKQLARYVQDAIEGFEPVMIRLIGPSRIGKTRLVEAIADAHGPTWVDGKMRRPVVFVDTPWNVSPKRLPAGLIRGLGFKTVPTTSAEVDSRLKRQLELAGTKFAFFDEANHTVDKGSKIANQAAGDFFKTVLDHYKLSVAVCGVPISEELISNNPQLRMRSHQAIEFRPYDWRIEVERRAFGQCVNEYQALFECSPWPIAVSMNYLMPHCYLFSCGAIGPLRLFMIALATRCRELAPRPLGIEDFVAALKKVEVAGDSANAFGQDVPAPVDLMRAHSAYLEEFGMSPKHLPTREA